MLVVADQGRGGGDDADVGLVRSNGIGEFVEDLLERALAQARSSRLRPAPTTGQYECHHDDRGRQQEKAVV